VGIRIFRMKGWAGWIGFAISDIFHCLKFLHST